MIPEWISEELAAGPINFERYMELALYHSTHGYYSAKIKTVGRKGDFSTTATLSQALAKAIAHWILEERKALSIKGPLHLIELGPGDGSLSRDILSKLPWLIRRRLNLHLVEVSIPLMEHQAKSLKKHTHKTSWHQNLSSALNSLPPNAHPLIYSNEFFDAFPIRIFRNMNELHLEDCEGELSETWIPTNDLPDSSLIHQSWPENQRLEIATSAKLWLKENLAHLERGSLLTIDYGGAPQEIYHRKPLGTIRGYLFHQLLTGPELYQYPGRCDLTADVNFDDLQAITQQLGLKTISLLNQSEFLTPHQVTPSSKDQFLGNPMGAGESFKVLRQRKP